MLTALVATLLESRADVVALQNAQGPGMVQVLRNRLRDTDPTGAALLFQQS